MIQFDKVKSLTLEITSYCNLHCPQCPRFDQEGFLNKDLVESHLNFDEFAKNFNLALFTKLETVTFEGDYGDCLMHPDIDKFIEFFKSVPTLQIVTNGSLRSTKWWSTLAQQKNVKVVFSIDGLEETNKIYRINSDWNKIISNAQSFINADGNASWKFIVFKHNEKDVEPARELAKNLGFADFTPVHTERSWWTGPVWPVKVEGKYLYNIEPGSITTSLQLRENVAALNFFKKDIQFDGSNCWLSNGAMYINSKGHVIPCCKTSGKTWQNGILDKLWRKIIGNIDSIDITKVPITEILNSDFYQSRLANSWKSEKTIHPTCVAMCSKKV